MAPVFRQLIAAGIRPFLSMNSFVRQSCLERGHGPQGQIRLLRLNRWTLLSPSSRIVWSIWALSISIAVYWGRSTISFLLTYNAVARPPAGIERFGPHSSWCVEAERVIYQGGKGAERRISALTLTPSRRYSGSSGHRRLGRGIACQLASL